MILSEKALKFISQSGIPTSGGLLYNSMLKIDVYKAIEMAEEDMRQKAIKAFEAACQSENLKTCTTLFSSKSVMPCCDCMKRAYFIGALIYNK